MDKSNQGIFQVKTFRGKMDKQAQWSIKNRLLLLTILPALVIAIILSVILSANYVNDLDHLAKEQGMFTTRHIANMSSFALSMGDEKLQQTLLNSALEDSQVRSVTLFDQKGQVLAHAGPSQPSRQLRLKKKPTQLMPGQLEISANDNGYYFTTPVWANNLISSTTIDSTKPPQLLGWLEVMFTTTHIAVKQYQTLFLIVLVSAIALLISGLIALQMSGSILNPLSVISAGIEKIKDGKLSSRISIREVGALRHLASGVNSMASSLQKAQEEMQQSIDQATEDLRETLETIEIQNIELDLARKEAIEASRMKSEFLANTSHEIRTPLNGIVGFTNLLLKGQLTGRQREYLTTIQQSSENLLSIINDILDFSKIEAGKLLLDHIPMNLREIVEESLLLLAPSAHEKKLELIQFIYSDVPTHLVGDPLRLKQVLTNLVNNAIKFTDKGNIIVRVMLENIKDKQAVITVSITDEGVGLNEDQRKELFSAFTQADASTSRKFGGTGLGLAICKRLVEQMGGDIGIDSSINQGSTFWFTIKADMEDQEYEQLTQLEDRSILFCEPNTITQTSISHLFEKWQLKTDFCDNYNFILDKVVASEKIYDAVVIGLSPEYDAIDSIKNIVEELDQNYNCGTIVLSSTTVKDRLDDALEDYVAICMSKPPSYYKLYDALCALILRYSKPTNIQQLRSRIREADNEHQPLQVLAVDDNMANLKLVSALLQELGAEVLQATSGEQAINLFKQHHFDIVLMDIQMPGMDGVETTKRMRATENDKSRTPIVALTAHALIEEKRQLLSTGLDDHLAKPLNENSLTKILHKWCERDSKTTQLAHTDSKEKTINDVELVHPSALGVDRSYSLKLVNGKVDLAKDMLNMLLNSLEESRHAINEAYHNRDHDALLETVHRLHGATCYCGVPNLKSIAATAETMIKKHQWQQLDTIIQQLNNEINILQEWHETENVDEFFA